MLKICGRQFEVKSINPGACIECYEGCPQLSIQYSGNELPSAKCLLVTDSKYCTVTEIHPQEALKEEFVESTFNLRKIKQSQFFCLSLEEIGYKMIVVSVKPRLLYLIGMGYDMWDDVSYKAELHLTPEQFKEFDVVRWEK
jgi:hypothetical protein